MRPNRYRAFHLFSRYLTLPFHITIQTIGVVAVKDCGWRLGQGQPLTKSKLVPGGDDVVATTIHVGK